MSYSEWLVQQVWNKAGSTVGLDSSVWRIDCRGNLIKRSEHGNRDSQFGWEIDHVVPKALEGTDLFGNLQPLHWRANVAKGPSPSVLDLLSIHLPSPRGLFDELSDAKPEPSVSKLLTATLPRLDDNVITVLEGFLEMPRDELLRVFRQ